MLSAENSLKVRLSVATRDVPPSSVGLSGARPSGAPRSSRLAATVWRSSSCSSPLIAPLLRRCQIDTPPRHPETDVRVPADTRPVPRRSATGKSWRTAPAACNRHGAVGRWCPSSHELQLVACGHAPLLLLRASGQVEQLVGDSDTPLGGRAAPRPSEAKTTLEPGDRLLLVSDGVL